ncbi:hypothetical protein [Amycolatopsis samaneae]|uniref:DUF4190 domain-containing protein n=1 Tax=Amycolatopsis samaneae TaxID=664691 RepID=A0ABW5GCQ9_9PSEU
MTYGPPSQPNAPVPQPGGAGWPGGPPPADRPQGMGYAVAALVLGLCACVAPLLPVDLTGVRAYVAFPPGVVGVALGIIGCLGARRGKALAIVGMVLCGIGMLLGVIMVANLTVR